MSKLLAAVSLIVGAFALILFVSFLLSYPLYLLWNGCLVDAVTIVRPVTWLQMWGIAVLIGLMFKSSTTVNKD